MIVTESLERFVELFFWLLRNLCKNVACRIPSHTFSWNAVEYSYLPISLVLYIYVHLYVCIHISVYDIYIIYIDAKLAILVSFSNFLVSKTIKNMVLFIINIHHFTSPLIFSLNFLLLKAIHLLPKLYDLIYRITQSL